MDTPNDQDPAEERPRRVAVKFVDGLFDPPYEDGSETKLPEEWMGAWKELDGQFQGITLRRVFTTVTSDEIEKLVEQAHERDRAYRPPDFFTFFVIDVPSLDQAEALAKILSGWVDIVDYAYVESLPMLATTQNQHYVEIPVGPPAPSPLPSPYDIGGIDAAYAWTRPGGNGSGVKFIDIEKGWCLTHPDLMSMGAPKIPAPIAGVNWGLTLDTTRTNFDYAETRHGTSVLGILAANDNPARHPGWRGIAHGATGHVISPWGGVPTPACDPQTGRASSGSMGPYSQPGVWNVPNAIMTANNNLDLGDVMLLELQADSGAPIEIDLHNFHVIRLGTALGITIVEPAGNGPNGATGSNIDPQITLDSGAIIVGAADPSKTATMPIPHAKSNTSNFGSWVDCFAWGNIAYSLDVDPASGDPGTTAAPCYTTAFDGTSAASAIIAGAAIVLQGFARTAAGLSRRLTAYEMRSILRDRTPGTNTPSKNNPNPDLIGVMPNLRFLIDNLGTVRNRAADLVIRDNLSDHGNPHMGLLSVSPDIIQRPAGTVTAAQATSLFGGGSPNMTNGQLSLPMRTGQGQDIFVRVFNRGAGAVTNARATVYWAPPGMLVTPNMWNLIGTSTPLGSAITTNTSSMTVLNRINWPTTAPGFPGVGHYCFIAVVYSSEDSNPIPDHTQLTQFLTFDEYLDLIRNNNSISWRNFDILPMPSSPAPMMMRFIAPGAYDADRAMQVEFESDLSEDAKLILGGPAHFVKALQNGTWEDTSEETMRITLRPDGLNRFKEIVFPANSQYELTLEVEIPPDRRDRAYTIKARQIYRGEQIGGITWRLEPPVAPPVQGNLCTMLREFFSRLAPVLRYLLLLLVPLTLIYRFLKRDRSKR